MSTNVYIRGSKEHPERVIAELEKRGGYNKNILVTGDNPTSLYRIVENGEISEIPLCWVTDLILTHPDWEEIFPEPDYRFNIGDTVRIVDENEKGVVTDRLVYKGMPVYKINELDVKVLESNLEPDDGAMLTWEDIRHSKQSLNGYFIHLDKIGEFKSQGTALNNKEVFKTYKQAKSAMAMAQISQLIEQPVYGGWAEIGEDAFVIDIQPIIICVPHAAVVGCCRFRGGILRFHTEQQAELFLRQNKELVMDYLMID